MVVAGPGDDEVEVAGEAAQQGTVLGGVVGMVHLDAGEPRRGELGDHRGLDDAAAAAGQRVREHGDPARRAIISIARRTGVSDLGT